MAAPSRTALRATQTLTLALALALAGAANAGSLEDARAQNAVRVLTDIQAIPESAIPDKLLDEARAIVVVPDSIKAGLVRRRAARTRPAVGEESRRQLVQPGIRHPHRRQHRLPGRRAVGGHRAGVPQRSRARVDRQRQVHPRRRCRRRRGPGRAQRVGGDRWRNEGRDLVVVAGARIVRWRGARRRGAVDRRRGRRGGVRPRHHAADDLRRPGVRNGRPTRWSISAIAWRKPARPHALRVAAPSRQRRRQQGSPGPRRRRQRLPCHRRPPRRRPRNPRRSNRCRTSRQPPNRCRRHRGKA